MPHLRDRRRSSSFRRGSSGRSSSYHAGSSGYRRPSPMSESEWSDVASSTSASGLPGVSPSDFAKGPPPDPRPGDGYAARWLKLVWMETYDAYATFVDTEKRKAHSFSDRAPLRVHVGGLNERTKLFALTITGADASREFALPEGVGGADFVHALLKLEQGAGWVYVKTVDARQGGSAVVSAGGKLFTDEMSLTQSVPAVRTGRGPHLCIAFDAFAACLGRFYALQQYSTVGKGIREAIEDNHVGTGSSLRGSLRGLAARGRGGSGGLLLPVPAGLQTKLNEVQLRILKGLRGPVDFVQGPPGTGKSTFIVELLRTRLPSGSKVLLCTTTNKAIDSLAEKLHASGHRDVVAFGNASRLGPTSLTLTLQSHLERHKTFISHAALTSAAKSARSKWKQLVKAAEQEAAEEIKASAGAQQGLDSGFGVRRDDAEERWLVALWRPEQKAWQRRLERLQAGLDELLGRPESSQRLTAYLTDLSSAFRLQEARAQDILKRTAQHAVEAIAQYLTRLGNFLKATPSTAHALMKLQILENARFVVCTAATAVKLPARIGHELESLSLSPAHKPTDSADAAAAGAADRLADSLAGLSFGRAAAVDPDVDQDASGEDERKIAMNGLLAGVLKFVYVVPDEGGAMLEPDMVGTVIHGCQFLLCVGDHKQLPPFTTWRDAEQYKYNTSLLQRLAATPGVAHDHNMMTVQYRMPARLAAIVSDLFYDGTLSTPPAIHASRAHPTPVVFQHVPGEEEKQGTSFKNAAEVRAVLRIVRGVAVPRGGGQASTVNIIAFHKPQSFALQRALAEAGVGGNVEVMTVDSMQGREADVVILSCVRTNGQLGFLANRNRLNVAISRAKQVLYIVGDRDSLRAGGSAAWRQLLDHGNVTLQVA